MTADVWAPGGRWVLLGFDWGSADGVQVEVAAVGADSITPVRLPEVLGFRATGSERYCCGWYDVARGGDHVVCDAWRSSDRGQCPVCARREGFVGVHRAHQDVTALPARIRTYLAQPHLLYVAAFADGTHKLGTVAESRLASRVAEQGPVAAAYVACSPDGVAVRRVEAALARALQLPLAVPTARKVRGLGTQLDVPAITAQLLDRATEAVTAVPAVAAPDDARPVDPPRLWDIPEDARRALATTPAEPFPHRLAEGAHRLYLVGLLGTVGLFRAAPARDRLFACDLNELRGREIEIGDFAHQRDEPWQPTLL